MVSPKSHKTFFSPLKFFPTWIISNDQFSNFTDSFIWFIQSSFEALLHFSFHLLHYLGPGFCLVLYDFYLSVKFLILFMYSFLDFIELIIYLYSYNKNRIFWAYFKIGMFLSNFIISGPLQYKKTFDIYLGCYAILADSWWGSFWLHCVSL